MSGNSQRSIMRCLNVVMALCLLLRSAAGVSSQEAWSSLKKQQAAGTDTLPSIGKVSPRKSLRTLLQSPPATGGFTSITIPLDFCGDSTNLSNQDIQSAVMNDPRSLQSFFQQCSFGALTLDDNDDSNRIITQKVPIRRNCGGCDIDAIGQEAEDWVAQNLNIDMNKYSIRIFVFPEGAKGCGFAGMGRQGCFDPTPGSDTNSRICRSWLTAFSSRALMHEVGHNLGLGHANKDGNEAGDCSSPMGNCAGYFCPNGYHGMMLGWYNPVDTMDIGSMQPDTWINKRLPARVATATNYLKLTGAGLEYYATYSAAVGWENEQSDLNNQVLVHSMVSRSDWSRSNIAAQLGAGQSDSVGSGGSKFVLRVANGASLAGATLQVCRADNNGQCDPSKADDSGVAQASLKKTKKKSTTKKSANKKPPPPKKKSTKKSPPPKKKN